ncbi:hypothetical protein NKH77_32030 [Streptomyces sp. M19]
MGELSDTPENRKEWGVDMVDHFRSGLGVISETEHASLDEVCGTKVATYATADIQDQILYQADCRQPIDLLPFEHRDAMVRALQTGKVRAVVLKYPSAAEEIGLNEPDTGLIVSLVSDGRGSRASPFPAESRSCGRPWPRPWKR